MKELLKEYGETLLDAMVVGLLIVFLLIQVKDEHGNKGAFQIVGAQMNGEGINYEEYTDFDAYERDSHRAAPVITYSGGNSICVGECQLTAYITAVGDDGTKLPVKVMGIVNEKGDELSVSDDSKVFFGDAGVYFVTVTAVDRIGKETACIIKIPVNEG